MIDKIGDNIFKIGVGLGILIFSIGVLKYVNKPEPTQEPIVITIKEYDRNEAKVEHYMDSVRQLSDGEQRDLVEQLARQYIKRYWTDKGHDTTD